MSAVKRFLVYVLGITPISDSQFPGKSDIYPLSIVVHQVNRTHPDFLSIIQPLPDCNYIVLRYDDMSGINLLKLSSLSEQFKIALAANAKGILFTEHEVRGHLKAFFSSHGGDSLPQSLNWVMYYLQNGPDQLREGHISFEEYQSFIKPGIKQWNIFSERFSRYSKISAFSSYRDHFMSLSTMVKEVDCMVTELQGLNHAQIMEKDILFYSKYLELIREIDYILIEISRKIFLDAPTS